MASPIQIEMDVFMPPPTAPLRDVEVLHILRALAHFEGNKTKASKSLGIDPKTLASKLKAWRVRALADRPEWMKEIDEMGQRAARLAGVL